ncbi:MAG TPA: host specificity protein J, partial [Flavobacteriales bacterium]|nr:host specificity protein J [Flavobacteriales bacterium]
MGDYVEQGRPQVTDIGAVASGGNTGIPIVSESHIEVADLLCEGPIEGIVSGRYDYYGTKGETGYQKVVTPDEGSPFGSYDPNNRYTATGTTADLANPLTSLGFLRSIYWNQVPVVDEDGYYNFQSINVEWVNGEPGGNLPSLNANMGGLTASEILDLSVNRNIGERLYGPDIKGNENAPSFTKGAELKDGTKIDKNAKTYTILNRECSSIIVNVKVSALNESIRNEDAPKLFRRDWELKPGGVAEVGYGDIKARTVEYWIYYQPVFDERFNMPSDSEFKNPTANDEISIKKKQTKWYGPVTERVFGKIDQGYIRSTKINLEGGVGDYKDEDGFDGWRIRIVRLTPEPLTSFFRAVTFVDSIVEVYGTKLRYPYSAMVYSKFDAENFSRVPARSYDTKLQKIKIPNNYDPITKTYGKSGGIYPTTDPEGYGTDPDNFWDGNFLTEKVWCDNPAWCFYDMLTNSRYGLGGYLKESEIDKWSLYEIAQYCDVLVADGYGSVEPRFTLNHLIISREEAYKLMNDLASAFRGLTYYSNGLVFAVQDAYKKPIYQLNNSNVVDGDFTYASSAKKARHTVALVRYIDKKNFFQPAIEYVSDEGAIKKYGIRQIETAAIGCTSRGQARRFGLWILASEKDETDSVSFKMGTAGAYLKPGDIIQIYDNNISPLKYSGRTNIVNGLVFAADPGENVIGNTAYNSVILDSALNFTADKSYKFSLLTPTYHYDANVQGLNSSGIKELKKSHIQTLYFSGAHTNTVTGDYRSDFDLGGSGVNTQIFFKTGYPFDQSYFANTDFGAPTGNQLDFDNYVITGYINSGVNVDGNSNTSVEYSGGYFNGENLVWSVEPYDETDKEFYSGNFSNFRIINSKENTDQTYDISALSYFSGKYDNVEQKVSFENPFLKSKPNCVEQAGFSVGRRDPKIGGVEQQQYELLNFSFTTVGYSSEPGTVNSGIDYLVAIKTGKDFTTIPGDTPTDLGYNGINATGYKLYHEPYHQLVIPGSDESQRQLDDEGLPSDIIEGNVFISEHVDHYVSVFAISPYGVLAPCGATGVLSKEDIIGTQSLVNVVDIYGLTTSDIPIGPGGTPGAKPTPSNAISIPGNTPNFNWQVGINVQFDEPGIYITNAEVDYRITIREPADPDSINIPSPNIYFEFTGYNSTVMSSPSFTFGTDYNNPNIYDAYNDSNSVAGGGAAGGTDESRKLYFKNDASGYLVQSGLSLPIRKFDIVVEAHDAAGRTSVGNSSIQKTKNSNKVYDNTITPESSELWN